MDQKKDYLSWHKIKSNLHKKSKSVFFHEREIWFCSLGCNIGYEQDGKHEYFERPVLILKKFNHQIFWGIPLTSQSKIGKYYFSFACRGKTHAAILSQIRLLDAKRLLRKVRVLPQKDFNLLKQDFQKLLP